MLHRCLLAHTTIGVPHCDALPALPLLMLPCFLLLPPCRAFPITLWLPPLSRHLFCIGVQLLAGPFQSCDHHRQPPCPLDKGRGHGRQHHIQLLIQRLSHCAQGRAALCWMRQRHQRSNTSPVWQPNRQSQLLHHQLRCVSARGDRSFINLSAVGEGVQVAPVTKQDGVHTSA